MTNKRMLETVSSVCEAENKNCMQNQRQNFCNVNYKNFKYLLRRAIFELLSNE